MPRSLKTDIPGTDWRVSPAEARERGWREVFAPSFAEPVPLVVEIGFGRGEFLMHLALANPDRAFVGVEYNRRRVLKMARRLARTEIRNVRLMEAMGQEVTYPTGGPRLNPPIRTAADLSRLHDFDPALVAVNHLKFDVMMVYVVGNRAALLDTDM